MEYTLEELLKSDDAEISTKAKRLVSAGFPKHAVFEIVLRQVIK